MELIQIFCLLTAFLNIYERDCEVFRALNISDYSYPQPQIDDPSTYRIAIFGTNDIHGSAFPLEITHPLTNSTYKYGGLEYLATYVRILRDEWKERFVWLDGGDQFQGAIESKISNGSIITDFFNAIKLNGSAIGNHEWDYGQPYLYKRLESAEWTYLAANIVNNKTNATDFLPNTKTARLLKVGKVKLGVIGLTTIETPFTTSGDLTDIKFMQYREIIVNFSNLLKSQGANAIVLTTHIGMRCPNDGAAKYILTMRNKNSTQASCQVEDEMSVLLNSLDEGVVDAVVAGHMHDVAHHWVNGVPVIQNVNGGYYSHVLYLNFDNSTMKLIKQDMEIEGPLPSCEKVFSNTRKCNFVTKTEAATAGDLRKFSFHNKVMKAEMSLDILFQKWWNEVKQYKIEVARTEETLQRGNKEENVLGNFVADCLKQKANADITIFNDGSLRSVWFPGEILVENVWNMFPFENTIVSFEMTGAEVKRMMTVLQAGKKAFYHTSGLMQNVTIEPSTLVSVQNYNYTQIDDGKTYIVASNDFMLGGGDDFKDVVTWYTARNVKNYGLLRNHLIDYLKEKKFVNREDLIFPDHLRLNILNKKSKVNKNFRKKRNLNY